MKHSAVGRSELGPRCTTNRDAYAFNNALGLYLVSDGCDSVAEDGTLSSWLAIETFAK